MKSFAKLVVALAIVAGLLAPIVALAQEKVVVEERTVTVLKKFGNSVVIRNDKGEIKKYINVPSGMSLMVDGKPATIADLKPGMKLKAVRFQDVPPPSTVTMAEVEAMPSDPAPPAAATPAAPAEPAAAPEEPAAAPEEPAAAPAELPPTGSVLPLLALLGSGLVGTGLALGRSRR